MARPYNPTQPRAPKGMPRGGQWTASGRATMQPRGKRSGAAGGKRPRGHVALKKTGPTHSARPDPYRQTSYHEAMGHLIDAHTTSGRRVHSSTPIPPVNRSKRPDWRRTG